MIRTQQIPLNDAINNGDTLFKWMGSFWTNLFGDTTLIRRMMGGEGMQSAQHYLDLVETLNLIDRNTAPVFHRDRWRLLTLKLSQRNTGPAAAVQLGSENVPVIGPQTAIPFRVGEVFKVGGYTMLAGVTTYPTGVDGLVDVVTTLTDNIVAPKKLLLRDVDFRIEKDTIVFYNNNDPFALGFPTRQITTATGTDTEIALWASDALIDKDYVYSFAGYVLGIRDVSSEFYAKYLNTLWDLYNCGASVALINAGIGALLDEPYIFGAQETIIKILRQADKLQVVTDVHVYDLTPDAVLNPQVVEGNTLVMGTMLTDTVRVYDNLDPSRLVGSNNLTQLKADIPALFLQSGFFRAAIRWGIGVSWELQDITYQGQDANNNPKLKFTVYGDAGDVDAFWQDFWQYCERNGISSETCFSGYLRDTVLPTDGAVWGSISPMEYFLYNFLKANLFIIAVDSNKLSAKGRKTLHLLGALKQVIPAHVCFFVVERQTIDTETYDMGTTMTDDAIPAVAKAFYETAGPDEYEKIRMTYDDVRPTVQLIPTCHGEVR